MAVWALLLSLTVAILLYPVRLQFEFTPIQSIYIFHNLPVFCVLYVAWLASLLWLLFGLGDDRRDKWLRIVLVAIFAIVYLGFWVVITPQGFTTDYEGGALSYANYILRGGEITSDMMGIFGYLQFPFTAFMGAGLSWITHLSLLDVRLIVLLVGSAMFGVAMFVFLKNTLKNEGLASVGAILVMQGSLILSRSLRFYPAGIGLMLFALFLMLLVKNDGVIFGSWRSKAIAFVMMAAITTDHIITSLYVIGVLIAIYLVQLIGKKKLIRAWFIIPLVAMPILWGLLWATPTVDYILGRTLDVMGTITTPSFESVLSSPPESVVSPSPESVEIVDAEVDVGVVGVDANGGSGTEVDINGNGSSPNGISTTGSGDDTNDVGSDDIAPEDVVVDESEEPSPLSLWWVNSMMTSYLGEGMPLWGKAIIVFWVLLSYIFGVALMCVNLVRIRKLDMANRIFTGGMLGVVVVSLLAIFATLSLGGYEFFRFLQFGSFFAIPLVLGFIWSLSRFRKQIAVALVIVPLFLLSLPTFLVHNNTIEADAVYPQEVAAFEFLAEKYGDGDGIGVFTSETDKTLSMFHLPKADYFINTCLVYTPKNVFYTGIEPMLVHFEHYQKERVFVYSEKFYWHYYHIYGIMPDDPKWAEFRANFVGLEKIYDNGFIQIYR